MERTAPSADRLQLLETFVRIVEAGSLSAAAVQLGATQPTVSRRLQALEQSLGLRLLQRSTHSMRLTEDGQRCFEHAKDLLAGWAAFESDLRAARDEPEGHLRVVVPHAFGQQQLVEPLASFLQRHARVSVEWLLVDEVRDFIGAGIDCAIQVGQPSDPGVVAVRLAQIPRIVVAAPSVLAGAAWPQDPDDLAALPWLALRAYYRDEVELTHRTSGQQRRFGIRPRVATDSLYALRTAALLGLGACVASAWLLVDDLAQQRLVHLAPSWQAAPLPVYIAYPRARFYPSRLLRFVETMKAAMPDLSGLMPGALR